ncbi:hypothetical protein Ais01nite_14120 [Asanoa ishikariensis]|uniref:BNR repeat-like domain-containing protein n=1 Tax=Asanoa ishikariensis TaxID=137265 RepID=A0A1H3UJ42_9ACTN|nr:sialidase family protein [Asanoa ishikariensis]GIF63377.1 hypothetical protein Ais01nite_14120 [Asanoa ishikariensis]SDZ62434.1 hypothetical protein SAMN05421684_7461 [Asanoa ishikariensis]
MREPDFAGLVESGRQAFRPDWDDVVAKAARKRRFLAAFGAAAVALVVAAGGGLATGSFGGADQPRPEPTGSPYALEHFAQNPVPGRSPIPQISVTSYAVAGDLDHLYVPVRDCRSQCVDLIAATADRGRTWTSAVMPGGKINASRFVVAAAGETVVAVVRGRPDARGDRTADYSTSTNAGRMWRPAPVAEVAELPADWVSIEVVRDRLIGLDPRTGDLASVALPILEARVLATPAEPSERWLFGYTGTEPTGKRGKLRYVGKSLAVSRDGGRTWSVRKLPKDDVFSDVTVANSKRVYALYQSSSAYAQRVFRSDDGGRTWDDGTEVPVEVGQNTIYGTADGGAYLSARERLFHTSDGRTVREVRDAPPPYARIVPVYGGGYLAVSLWSQFGMSVSDDGRSWTRLETPVLRL